MYDGVKKMKIERNFIFTCHTLNDKEKRSLLIYDLIRKRGIISRSEITKATGINAVSVSNYINNFIEKKMVLEKGFDISTGGRKPELIELNTEANHVIGIDIGKREIRGAIADLGINIKVRKQIHRPADREVSSEVVRLVEDMIAASKINITDIKAVGLGLSDEKFINVVAAIKKKTGIDAFYGPSAACAAFAERRINQSADVDNLLYIYSDVGEGVMMHQDIYLSASEDESLMEGKLRYLRPWDDYLSIAESARREVARGVGTKMVSLAKGNVNNITREDVMACARADDEVALNIVLSAGINLGLRIAYLVNLFAPEIVVIGGGAQDAGDIILMPLKKTVDRLAFRDHLKGLKIITSTLGEDAVDIGAASLAIREVFIKA